MLQSLFGDLGAARDRDRKGSAEDEPDKGFAATAILESVATEVNDRGQMVDRHLRELVVTGSPAQAIREHFSATRADLETASRMITLIDPVGIWASAVIKALSDAGGQPVERLQLREQSTLRTLALIERTTLVRRHEDTLRIVHADVRAPGPENAEIPVALMERSHMTTVIIGSMQPHAIDALLGALQDAASLPTWRCPNLLFMLPPSAVWIANKIGSLPWPPRVHVHVTSEPMTSASAVWNAMLGMWNHVKSQPGWEPAAEVPAALGMSEFPIRVADLTAASMPRPSAAAAAAAAAANAAASAAAVVRVSRGTLDPERARHALTEMLTLDGLLGCAVVDSSTGLVLAREVRDERVVDLELAAAACAQVLRAHRQAARNMGLPDQIDEIMTSAGPRQQVMRTLSRHPELFLVALLDKQRTNLALTRYKLAEVERGLY
jgi:predicted regulator of Ras-like GTPase activity (Roadblock/LC7/MglB family)